MARPIVEQETEDGEVRSTLKPGNLEPDESYELELLRVSYPYEGRYGPYLFAEVATPEGEQHTVIVSHSVKAPGFVGPGEKTAFEEAFEARHGEYPQRRTPGRSLAECFYEAPLESEDTRLVRRTGETEDGMDFNLYHFGLPEDEPGTGSGIQWREAAPASA